MKMEHEWMNVHVLYRMMQVLQGGRNEGTDGVELGRGAETKISTLLKRHKYCTQDALYMSGRTVGSRVYGSHIWQWLSQEERERIKLKQYA